MPHRDPVRLREEFRGGGQCRPRKHSASIKSYCPNLTVEVFAKKVSNTPSRYPLYGLRSRAKRVMEGGGGRGERNSAVSNSKASECHVREELASRGQWREREELSCHEYVRCSTFVFSSSTLVLLPLRKSQFRRFLALHYDDDCGKNYEF